jgi:hypothetical protein
MAEERIRCGDHVLHRPSGEEWVVAYADYESGNLAWAGWPDGSARIEDCDRIKTCDDLEHAAAVASWSRVTDDSRPSVVARLYGSATAQAAPVSGQGETKP